MTASKTRGGRMILGAVSFLVAAALACGGGGGGSASPTPAAPQIDTAGTAAALQSTADALAAAQTEQAQVPPTPVQLPTAEVVNTEPPPPTEPSGPTTYVDDFSEDRGNWEIFSNDVGSAQIRDGVLLLGPFQQCSDVGQGSGPFGCFTQCLGCGIVSEYDMQVDAAYISGVSDRTFGMVLRFIDQNGDGWVDADDYFLDFELSVYDQFFAVYEHNTNGQWSTLDQRHESNIRGGSQINTLRAHSYNGGNTIDLYLNGTLVETITVNSAFSSGTVGLVVGFRAMQAGFDNFQITLP